MAEERVEAIEAVMQRYRYERLKWKVDNADKRKLSNVDWSDGPDELSRTAEAREIAALWPAPPAPAEDEVTAIAELNGAHEIPISQDDFDALLRIQGNEPLADLEALERIVQSREDAAVQRCIEAAKLYSASGGEGDPIAESNVHGYNDAVAAIVAELSTLLTSEPSND